jgi:hypothetical protein
MAWMPRTWPSILRNLRCRSSLTSGAISTAYFFLEKKPRRRLPVASAGAA